MASTVIMPQLGETVAEGKILAWFKSIGDPIKEGDNLFEVETDKVTIEVQAVVAGRLTEIRVRPGATAKVGDVVAVVGDGAAANPPARAEVPGTKAAPWRSPFEEVATPSERFGPAKGPSGVRLTPLARRLIAQHGLDLAHLAAEAARRGEKKIDEASVRKAIAAPPAAPAPPPSPARRAAGRKLAVDPACLPGDRDRFHCARSRAKGPQGGVPEDAWLLAHLSAFHRPGHLLRDRRLPPGQRAL
jgi:pyruvate/2-oxoglutarate dehydrogenase complex dihydrolipoamide acyltransferase (E2) component